MDAQPLRLPLDDPDRVTADDTPTPIVTCVPWSHDSAPEPPPVADDDDREEG